MRPARVCRAAKVSRLFSSVPNAVNLNEFIRSIQHTLKPPVANKLLHDGFIKTMIVGGPNQRKDYHIEMGEELFYQVKGAMDLDLVLDGTQQRIHIKEGDMFLLPRGVPHSPQRYADSVGIVLERARSSGELDCMRWYTEEEASTSVLYEEFFHCTDLGSQIKQAIERYNKVLSDGVMDQSGSRYPGAGATFRPPTNLQTLMAGASKGHGVKRLFDSEFRVDCIQHVQAGSPHTHNWFSRVSVELRQSETEVLLWQQHGDSEVELTHKESKRFTIRAGEVVVVPAKALQGMVVEQHHVGDSLLCIFV
jgi:3-hydroxyanthranilate 3,4-dioxygenase